MRYALTFTLGGFERTDTIIVEVSGDPAKHIFGDEAKDKRVYNGRTNN